jgi:hypothetical protein
VPTELLAELLPIAIAISTNPPAIIAVVLMLSSERSRRTAVWFVLGWLAGLLAVGAGVLLIGDAAGMEGGPSLLGASVRLLIGVALVGLALRKWFGGGPAGGAGKMPAWMQTVTALSPVRSFGFSALFAGLNPKTLALNVAGAIVISETVAGRTGRSAALVVFAVVSSLSLIAPLVYGLVAPRHSRDALGRMQLWLVSNNRAITAGVLGVLGAVVVFSAVQDLLAM